MLAMYSPIASYAATLAVWLCTKPRSALSAFRIKLQNAEFERSLLRERQREGIVLAKRRGAYRGRKHSLSAAQITDLKRGIAAGERKAHVAREFGLSRETVYQYLRAPA